jgi:hypothetical protein
MAHYHNPKQGSRVLGQVEHAWLSAALAEKLSPDSSFSEDIAIKDPRKEGRVATHN